MNHPKVSIIILNWNGKKYLNDCLTSVFSQIYPNYEVILVDNASTDGSVEFVRENFPGAKLIQNNENLGFAEGNNIGIKVSSGKYIATLNNDTKVDPDWLMELIEVAEREDADMCASKMLSYKNTNIIDSTGILMFKDGGAIDRGTGQLNSNYNQIEEVFGPCAGAALYKREIFDEIGLFDADYFAYFEDVDLAWRARLAGCKCFFVPSAIVYHIKAGSASSPFVLYHSERNRIWNIAKNMSLMSIICNLHWIIAKWVVLRVWFHRKNIKELARADIDALKGLSRMLKKRREIQKLRVVPDSDIRKWMISPIEHWRIKRRMAK